MAADTARIEVTTLEKKLPKALIKVKESRGDT